MQSPSVSRQRTRSVLPANEKVCENRLRSAYAARPVAMQPTLVFRGVQTKLLEFRLNRFKTEHYITGRVANQSKNFGPEILDLQRGMGTHHGKPH